MKQATNEKQPQANLFYKININNTIQILITQKLTIHRPKLEPPFYHRWSTFPRPSFSLYPPQKKVKNKLIFQGVDPSKERPLIDTRQLRSTENGVRLSQSELAEAIEGRASWKNPRKMRLAGCIRHLFGVEVGAELI